MTIQFKDIDAECFPAKIQTLLADKRFSEKAKEISRIFQDSPMDAMELAMYHIEYVMRHKGAKHLKSVAIELTWYQNLLLDIVGFVLLLLIIAFWVVKLFFKLLMQLICPAKKSTAGSNKTKRKTH